MRSLALVFLCGCSYILPKDNPMYPLVLMNPGVKAAYTFGPGGGWTYGFELSFLAATGKDLHAVVAAGPDVNFTWRHGGTFDLRLGLDLVSWFVGTELGPSLVLDPQNRPHFGFGITTWASAVFFDPYWTYTIVRHGDNLNEWGMYTKLPICLAGGCASGGSSGDHWWHIDD
jgi:hypothetical protein